MNHPETILRTLDENLVQPTRLILYGRAALALGFPPASPAFLATLDVDVILPEIEMATIDGDDQFWEAVEKTNSQLEPSGLYITHLFSDSQVILSPNWLDNIQAVTLDGINRLNLFRPSTCDLILTKMMRVDPQDRSDIDFLLSRPDADHSRMNAFLESARIPAIPEIREAFEENTTWLRSRLANH